MTRTERAIRKAQKAAKVAYKLAKAPTPYEFTNPVDLMTKEEKFQWELEKYFEDIKGTQYYDEVMSTCEWLLNDEETWVSESTTGRELAQWVFNEYYRSAACKTVAGIPEYKERIKYTREVAQMMGLDALAENAKTFLEAASKELAYSKPHETELKPLGNVRPIHTINECKDIGNAMNICVGGYRRMVHEGRVDIAVLEDNGAYIACLEIKDGELVQAKLAYNRKVNTDPEVAEQVRAWCELNSLTIDTPDM